MNIRNLAGGNSRTGGDVLATGTVTNVNFAARTITITVLAVADPKGFVNAGDIVGPVINIANSITYFVDAAGDLIRQVGGNPNIIAQNVQNFQVQYGFDNNNDNVITEVGVGADDDDWVFNVAGDTPPINTDGLALIRVTLSFSDTDMDGNAIVRQVQFTQAVRNLLLSKGMI